MQVAVSQEEQLSGTESSDVWVREVAEGEERSQGWALLRGKDTSLVPWCQLSGRWQQETTQRETELRDRSAERAFISGHLYLRIGLGAFGKDTFQSFPNPPNAACNGQNGKTTPG